MGIAKIIDPGQPAQADHGRNFSLLADFLCIKVPLAVENCRLHTLLL